MRYSGVRPPLFNSGATGLAHSCDCHTGITNANDWSNLGPRTRLRYPRASSTFPSSMGVATMPSEAAVRFPVGQDSDG